MRGFKQILMAGAILAAAGSAFGQSAADQNGWLECQRQITDGSTPNCQTYLRPDRATPSEASAPSASTAPDSASASPKTVGESTQLEGNGSQASAETVDDTVSYEGAGEFTPSAGAGDNR